MYWEPLDIHKLIKIMILTSINSMKKIMIDMRMMKLKKKRKRKRKGQFWLNCKMSMCNEIEFNVIFLVVPLQWIVVNIVGIYWCDFTIFTS